MGTWGHKVGQSDTFADVYDCFFEHYNSGATPLIATKQVREEFDSCFSDYDDMFDAHFALALAQWETQSLEPSVLVKVEQFIESGAELKRWEGTDASDVSRKKRREALDEFLDKLLKPNAFKKRRKRRKFDFRENVLIKLAAPDGQKVLSICESYVDGEYVHTVATIMWGRGGGSIFHVTRRDLQLSAEWAGSQNLEIRIPESAEALIKYSLTPNQAYFSGDSVAISYKYV